MLTVVLCHPREWRALPAWARHAGGWQWHWMGLYLEWRRGA